MARADCGAQYREKGAMQEYALSISHYSPAVPEHSEDQDAHYDTRLNTSQPVPTMHVAWKGVQVILTVAKATLVRSWPALLLLPPLASTIVHARLLQVAILALGI